MPASAALRRTRASGPRQQPRPPAPPSEPSAELATLIATLGTVSERVFQAVVLHAPSFGGLGLKLSAHLRLAEPAGSLQPANAEAYANGVIFVDQGLVSAATAKYPDAVLAFIIGHEAAHVAMFHGETRGEAG